MSKIAAILLAAGSSVRMGNKNKLLLPIFEQPILDTTISNLMASKLDKLIMVTGHESNQIEALVPSSKCAIVHNPQYEKGMTSSIQAGINHCKENYDGYMICLADMPFIKTETYNLLIEAFNDNSNPKKIIVPSFSNKRGNPIIFSTYYKALILEHNEKEGCKKIVRKHQSNTILIATNDKGILLDIDTPDDYDSYLK